MRFFKMRFIAKKV